MITVIFSVVKIYGEINLSDYIIFFLYKKVLALRNQTSSVYFLAFPFTSFVTLVGQLTYIPQLHFFI